MQVSNTSPVVLIAQERSGTLLPGIGSGLIDVPLWLALILIPLAAIIGNLVGYWIGYRVGPALFRKEDSKIFKKEYVEKTSEFFNEYGKRAIIMARFVPIVRTFITAMQSLPLWLAKQCWKQLKILIMKQLAD